VVKPKVFVNYLNTNKIDPLHSVITWKSKVMSVKKVAIDFIGYGTSFLAEEK
jgi:alanine racemase